MGEMEFVSWPNDLSQEQYELRRDICTRRELNRLTVDPEFQKFTQSSSKTRRASEAAWAGVLFMLLVGSGIGWRLLRTSAPANEVVGVATNADHVILQKRLADAEANFWWSEQIIRDLEATKWYDDHKIQELQTKLAQAVGRQGSMAEDWPNMPENFLEDATVEGAEDASYDGPGWSLLILVTATACIAIWWCFKTTKKKHSMSKELEEARSLLEPEEMKVKASESARLLAETHVQGLQKANKSLQVRIEELEQTAKDDGSLIPIEEEIRRQEQEISRQEHQLQGQAIEIAAKEEEAERQIKQLRETESLVNKLQKQIQALEDKVVAANLDSTLKAKQIEQLSADRQAEVTQLEAAKLSSQEQESVNAGILKDLNSKEETLKKLAVERGQIAEERDELMHECEAQTAQIEILQKDVSASKSKNKVLQDAHDNASLQLQELKAGLQDQQTEKEALGAQVQALGGRLKQLEQAKVHVTTIPPGIDTQFKDPGPFDTKSKIPRLAISPSHSDRPWYFHNQCFPERDSCQDVLTTHSTGSLDEAVADNAGWILRTAPQLEGSRLLFLDEKNEDATLRSSPLPLGTVNDTSQNGPNSRKLKKYRPKSGLQSPAGSGDKSKLTGKDAEVLALANSTIVAETAKQVADLAEEVFPKNHPARELLRLLKIRLDLPEGMY